jgi:hypothetical protein
MAFITRCDFAPSLSLSIRPSVFGMILAAILFVFPVRFAVQLAADPDGPKDSAGDRLQRY